MLLYGLVPTGMAMFAVAMVHSVCDGLSVSSTGVAVGLVVPGERQAGAQGVLGGLQTLVAGITALLAGALYEHAGRTTAYAVSATMMVVLVAAGVLLAGPAWRLRGAPDDGRHRSGAGDADRPDRRLTSRPVAVSRRRPRRPPTGCRRRSPGGGGAP